MENDVQSLMKQNMELLKQAYNEKWQIWLEHIIFSWRWWLGILLIALCVWIWTTIRKRKYADRLFYAGFFTAVLSTLFDLSGIFFGLWDYRYEVFPALQSYLPWGIFIIPTSVMILLMVRPQMNVWIKAVILGVFISFIGLPFLHWLGLYKPVNWNYIYSFPIMMLIYFIAHIVSRREKFAPFTD